MPNAKHYANEQYPTIFDYKEQDNEVGLAIIDEMYYESHFLSNAALEPTNDGFRQRFKRETEKVKTGHVASLDEGYYGTKKVAPLEEQSFGTMRVTDQLRWEHKQAIGSVDGGANLRAKQLKDATDSIIRLKQNKMLYANSVEDTSSLGEKAKSINGLFTYVEHCYNSGSSLSAYEALKQRYDEELLPFTNTKEKLLCFSNYDSNRTNADTSAYVTTKKKFTSVLGVAFGSQGVLTVFPQLVGKFAGMGMDYKANIEAEYTDSDGITKSYEYDRMNFDAYFGIGVENRYCLSAVRNIFLGHTNKTAKFEEMESVENYLIMLKDFFDKGNTGLSMAFYCSPDLITQMEQYQKEAYIRPTLAQYAGGTPSGYSVVGGRDFDGINPRKRPSILPISHDIVLLSDRVFKTTETYISGTVTEAEVLGA